MAKGTKHRPEQIVGKLRQIEVGTASGKSVAMPRYMLLQRNLIYTGITRAKRLLVVVGQKKGLGLAIRNDQSRKRYSGLLSRLKETSR
jgi:superfamily I DNA/RNA helicase